MTPKRPHGNSPLILVVDDDLSLRLATRNALKKAGFQVVEAENGRAAVNAYQTSRPDLVLMDVVMPEMDGFEACTAIRKLPGGDQVQILMVTGLDDVASTQRAFEVGANDFIAKPINWVMLVYRVRYMLRAGETLQALTKSRARLAKAQEIAKLGNWEIDLATGEFYCSRQVYSLLGLGSNEAEMSYERFLSTINAPERYAVKNIIDRALRDKKSYDIHYRVILPQGEQRYIYNCGEVTYDEFGKPELMIGSVQDVSKLKRAEEEIRFLAFYDGLTGLANRRLLTDRLERAITLAQRNKRYVALLIIGLDRFKRINDTLGHHVGDLLLKHVSDGLQKSIRKSDSASRASSSSSNSCISRLGGDEFTVLLPDLTRAEDAALVASRMLKELATTYELEGHDVSITASIGISVYPTDGEDQDTLLKKADTAMRHAKSKGRNNYQFFKEDLNIATVERFNLENDLRKALERDELVLYYQPQLDLTTRKIIGAEALIRWLHPQKGMIPPFKFIPMAEESDLIVEINKWVLKTACQQNRQWQQAGLPPLKVAVNLSGHKFAEQNIVETIHCALEDAELDVGRLEVEITENILMQKKDDTVSILEELNKLDLRVALDDFGTGYSSLSYLTSFPVKTLKIDRSFVMGCTAQPNNKVIIKAIIAMGHSLGMKIVAEGIETEEHYDLLLEYGCDEGQGYLFSPPLPNADFVKLVQNEAL